MQAETFFSQQDKAAIEAAISQVEKRTSGEVAVMVVDTSDSYPEAQVLCGLVLGSALALALTELFFNESLWAFVPMALGVGLLCGLLSRFSPALLRLFCPAPRLETMVQRRALQAFYEKGLDKTRDKTGVLFFISLLEHRVWVLADEGIYQKIAPEELQGHASQVALGIKKGQTATLLCQEIAKVGDILAKHFPIKADDTNELSNSVIVG